VTAVLPDRLAVDDITRQAREIQPARTVLSWVAAALFFVGWLAYQTCAVAWLIAAWVFVAVREGWRAAKVSRGPARSG